MEKEVEVLKKGIIIEKNGLSSYLGFAYQTKDPHGKNMFIRLAQDELKHMEILEKELNEFMCSKTWVCEDISESVIEKIAPRIRDIDKIKSQEGQDELSALKIALDLEKKSIAFYTEAQKNIDNPDARHLFERLVEMEESHYDLIQAEIDHIEQTGFWFGIREFTMEGERN